MGEQYISFDFYDSNLQSFPQHGVRRKENIPQFYFNNNISNNKLHENNVLQGGRFN